MTHLRYGIRTCLLTESGGTKKWYMIPEHISMYIISMNAGKNFLGSAFPPPPGRTLSWILEQGF